MQKTYCDYCSKMIPSVDERKSTIRMFGNKFHLCRSHMGKLKIIVAKHFWRKE